MDQHLPLTPRVVAFSIHKPFHPRPLQRIGGQVAPCLHHGRTRAFHREHPTPEGIIWRELQHLNRAGSAAFRGSLQRRTQTRTPSTHGDLTVPYSAAPGRALANSTSLYASFTGRPRTGSPVCGNLSHIKKGIRGQIHAARQRTDMPHRVSTGGHLTPITAGAPSVCQRLFRVH